MSEALFTLSAFGDEIDDDLAMQLDVLAGLDIHALELRSAWGRNVLDLDAGDLARAAALLRERGCAVSAIGSPIGKSLLSEAPTFEMQRLERAVAAADALDTRRIRIFSFFVSADEAQQRRDEVLQRLGALAQRAAEVGVVLVHENEKGIYGATAARCHDLLTTINSAALQAAFDPANFVQVGERPMADAWPLLAERTTHVHIKDALFADGSVCPAGSGDGEVPALLTALDARGYQGYLTLEPHLQIAGYSGGYSGAAGMVTACAALRTLLATLAA